MCVGGRGGLEIFCQHSTELNLPHTITGHKQLVKNDTLVLFFT